MINIKQYMDGDRLVIVIEKAGQNAEMVNEFISKFSVAVMGVKSEKPQGIPNLVPVEVEEETKPSFQNMVPIQNHAKEEAAMPVKQAIQLFKEGKPAVISGCKKIILEDAASRNWGIASKEDFKEFIGLYMPILNRGVKQILEMAGYESIDDFISYSPEEQIQEAYFALLDLVKRMMS